MQLITCSKCNDQVYVSYRTIELPFVCFSCRAYVQTTGEYANTTFPPQDYNPNQKPHDYAPPSPQPDDTTLLIEDLQTQLESTKKALDKKNTDLRATESAYRALNTDNLKLQGDKNEQSSQLISLLGELEDSRVAREEAEHYEARSIGIVVKALNDVNALEAEIVTQRGEIERLQDHLKMEIDLSYKRQDEVNRLKATIDSLRGDVRTFKIRAHTLQNENQALQSKVVTLTKLYNDEYQRAGDCHQRAMDNFNRYTKEAAKTWYDKLAGR